VAEGAAEAAVHELEALPEQTAPPAAFRRLAVVGLVVAALAAALLLIGLDSPHLISLSQLQARRHELKALVADHPILSLGAYVGLYFLVSGLSLPGALVMTLSGGFLFGLWEGAAAAVIGVSSGATAMFAVARSAWGEALRAKALKTSGLLQRLEAGVSRNAFVYILTLRLIPGLPIWLVNVSAGLIRMRTSSYVAATLIGVTPSTVVYAAIGSGLGTLFERGERPEPSMLLQPQWLAMMAGLVGLAFLPVGWRLLSRRRR
jgi:uncharacterized membrane protein YdjX (TVP38/TMEM64 family)